MKHINNTADQATIQANQEPSIEDIELEIDDDAPDGLALLVQHSIATRPGFVDVWAPFAVIGKLIDERQRLGLSQAEVALRMGVARTSVAKLENDPPGVAFARIMAYARALGVELAPKPSKLKPKLPKEGPGRKVRPPAASGQGKPLGHASGRHG